jgi:hypothetical protein
VQQESIKEDTQKVLHYSIKTCVLQDAACPLRLWGMLQPQNSTSITAKLGQIFPLKTPSPGGSQNLGGGGAKLEPKLKTPSPGGTQTTKKTKENFA